MYKHRAHGLKKKASGLALGPDLIKHHSLRFTIQPELCDYSEHQ